jgi:hypothetical protein
MHHQVKVFRPWFDSLENGERWFVVIDDRGFAIGDIVHLWEYEEVPSPDGPVELHTGKRLRRAVKFVLSEAPGLVFGWVVIGLGQVQSSGSGNAGTGELPAVIPLTQAHRERIAA